MPRLSLIPTILREKMSTRQVPREPEPSLVMDEPESVSGFTDSGRVDGIMSAAYLFHSARISAVITGRSKIVDLGCGPATQLAQVARLNPEARFLGVDMSSAMLSEAEDHIRAERLTNVELAHGDICALTKTGPSSVDAVMSTMALHHLPTIETLQQCFSEIRRILKPGGAVYLADFGRLKRLESMRYFAYMNEAHQPPAFSLDYERSLKAAFLRSDFVQLCQTELPFDVSVVSPMGIPVLVIMKTPDRGVSSDTARNLRKMRCDLPSKYRRELDDMRALFWMSGLRNDPFGMATHRPSRCGSHHCA